MIGALVAHFTVLPFPPAKAIVLLVMVGFVFWVRRAELPRSARDRLHGFNHFAIQSIAARCAAAVNSCPVSGCSSSRNFSGARASR